MGFFDRFRRNKSSTDQSSVGVGADYPLGVGEDGPPEAGGPSPFSRQLMEYRWVAANESRDTAQAGYDIEDWPNNRYEFDLEEALAWGHEATRSRLAIWATNAVAGEPALPERAGMVADAIDSLEDADKALADAAFHHNVADLQVKSDPIEQTRFNRNLEKKYWWAKLAVTVLLVASEVFMTGFVFDSVLPNDYQGLGYGFVIAAGTLAILLYVPHKVAQGIKEGALREHGWAGEEATSANPLLKRLADSERLDDRVMLISSLTLLGVLFLMIVFLSILRNSHLSASGSLHYIWLPFFIFLQAAISGTFFVIEWIDYGPASKRLMVAQKALETAQSRQKSTFQSYVGAITNYFVAANPIFKNYLDLGQHDNVIVAHFQETLNYGRHIQNMTQGADDAYFIRHASTPIAPVPTEEGVASDVPNPRDYLYSIYDKHEPLAGDTFRARSWLFDEITKSLKEVERTSRADPQRQDGTEDDRWNIDLLVDGLPKTWLIGHLWECYGLRLYCGSSAEVEGYALTDEMIPTSETSADPRPHLIGPDGSGGIRGSVTGSSSASSDGGHAS